MPEVRVFCRYCRKFQGHFRYFAEVGTKNGYEGSPSKEIPLCIESSIFKHTAQSTPQVATGNRASSRRVRSRLYQIRESFNRNILSSMVCRSQFDEISLRIPNSEFRSLSVIDTPTKSLCKRHGLLLPARVFQPAVFSNRFFVAHYPNFCTSLSELSDTLQSEHHSLEYPCNSLVEKSCLFVLVPMVARTGPALPNPA